MAGTMPLFFRRHWRELRRGRPGHRFQARYERARKEQHRSGAGQRVILVVLALIFIAIGVVLSVIPGPAIPFFFLGGGLLATESKPIARFMDWCEVLIRKIIAWGKRHWKRLPLIARIVLIVVGVCCSAATGYLAYRFMRG
jgi:hypothetical protein